MVQFSGGGVARLGGSEREIGGSGLEGVGDGCSQDIADSSDKDQALTETGFEMSSFGFTAIDSAADNMESASLMFAISMVPRSTSWNQACQRKPLSCCRPTSW